MELFPAGTIGAVAAAGAARDPGGHLRRLGDGLPPPGTRDPAAEREEAAARAHELLGEAQGRADVESGRVAPGWRAVEHAVDAVWRPRVVDVSDDSRTKLMLREFVRPQARWSDPDATREGIEPVWLRTVVDVDIDERGDLVAARIAVPSGRRALDRMALAAVCTAVRSRPVRDAGGPSRARFTVGAAIHVTPPTPTLGFGLDEHGRPAIDYPMKETVLRQVRLDSVRPR